MRIYIIAVIDDDYLVVDVEGAEIKINIIDWASGEVGYEYSWTPDDGDAPDNLSWEVLAIDNVSISGIGSSYSKTITGRPFNFKYWDRTRALPNGAYAVSSKWYSTPPEFAPINLIATSTGYTSIELEWDAPATPKPTNIYRLEGSSPVLIGSVAAGVSMLAVTNLFQNTTYSYIARHFNFNQDGTVSETPDSNEATATTDEVIYIYRQDFDDAVAAAAGWSLDTAVPDWSVEGIFTTPCALTNGAGLYRAFTAMDVVSVHFKYRPIGFATGIIQFSDIVVNIFPDRIEFNRAGLLASVDLPALTLVNYADLYWWFDYSNISNTISAVCSQLRVKPTLDATNGISYTHASNTAQCDGLYIRIPGYIDELKVLDSPIGSAPP